MANFLATESLLDSLRKTDWLVDPIYMKVEGCRYTVQHLKNGANPPQLSYIQHFGIKPRPRVVHRMDFEAPKFGSNHFSIGCEGSILKVKQKEKVQQALGPQHRLFVEARALVQKIGYCLSQLTYVSFEGTSCM